MIGLLDRYWISIELLIQGFFDPLLIVTLPTFLSRPLCCFMLRSVTMRFFLDPILTYGFLW